MELNLRTKMWSWVIVGGTVATNLRLAAVSFGVLLLAGAAVTLRGCGAGVNNGNEGLTVVSYGGGEYQRSQREALFFPFESEFSVDILEETWYADYDQLVAEVKRGQWDVIEVPDVVYRQGIKAGLFSRLTFQPDYEHFLPGTVSSYGIGNIYWATGLAVGTSNRGSEQPRDWGDFWNLEGFPGPRGLRDHPQGTLEFALLAGGVRAEELYPLDIDRAFRKLNEIKRDITCWWIEGSKPVGLLTHGKLAFSSAWSGRIFAARREGIELGFIWKDAALELDRWVVSRKSSKPELANRFLEFASAPGRLADQAQRIGYGPVHLGVMDLLRPGLQSQLPTSYRNWSQAFIIDAEWWAANEDAVHARWRAWREEGPQAREENCGGGVVR